MAEMKITQNIQNGQGDNYIWFKYIHCKSRPEIFIFFLDNWCVHKLLTGGGKKKKEKQT